MNRHTDESPASRRLDAQLDLIREAGPPTDVQERLRQHMRQTWAAIEDKTRSSRRPWWSQWLAPGRLAAMLAGLGVLVGVVAAAMVFVTPRTVYAQALEAVRQAQAIHARGFLRSAESQGTKQIEIWYAAERGVRETVEREAGTEIRLDNGQFEWLYRSSTNTVTKRPSQDPVGHIDDFLEPLKAIEKLDGQRDASLDQELDGRHGRAWVMVRPTRGASSRYVVWLDKDHRLLRFEQQDRADDEWVVNEMAELRYDVAVPAGTFAAAFPEGAKLIDWTQGADLAARYPLDGAIATAERLGLILAIHKVRRVDPDTIYVMSTTRGSEQVIEEVGPIPPRSAPATYGEFMWSSNGRRMADHRWVQDYAPIALAEWEHDGVHYAWMLLRHVNSGLSDRLPVGFHVYARGHYRQKLEAEGRTFYLWGEKDVLTLDLPKQAEGLETVLADVYQQVGVFEQINRNSRLGGLRMPSVPYSPERIEQEAARGVPRSEAERMSTMIPGVPSEISLEQWSKTVFSILEQQDQERAEAH